MKNKIILLLCAFSLLFRCMIADGEASATFDKAKIDENVALVSSYIDAGKKMAGNAVVADDIPAGYQVIPGKLSTVQVAVGGDLPLVIGINDKGGLVRLAKDWRTWNDISPYPQAVHKLANGTVIALKFYGGKFKGKYLEVKDGRLSATGTSKDSPSCQFELLRHDEYVGLRYVPQGNVQAIPQGASGERPYSTRVSGSNFANDDAVYEKFQVTHRDPASLSKVAFLANATGGYLTAQADGSVWTSIGLDGIKAQTKPTDDSFFDIEVIRTNQGAVPVITFTGVSVAADETMWAIDSRGRPWRSLPGERDWFSVHAPKKLKSISVGSKSAVIALDVDDGSWIKRAAPFAMPVDLYDLNGMWSPLTNDKQVAISVGGDGTIWAAGQDQYIHYLKRSPYECHWKALVRPADIDLGGPAQIRVTDSNNITYIDFQNNVCCLKPGCDGKARADWDKLAIKMKVASKGWDGTIVGVDMQGRVMVKKPTEDDTKALNKAFGSMLHYNQIFRLACGPMYSGSYVWTHAQSAWAGDDAHEPNNFVELRMGRTDENDFRQDQASFFAVTPEDRNKIDSKEPVQFGDIVDIYSLYAASWYTNRILDQTKRSGPLSREWRWWVQGRHFQFESVGDVLVSLIAHPHATDGSQRFQLMSPYNKMGIIRAKDAIEIHPLQPDVTGPLYGDTWSRFNDGSTSIQVKLAKDQFSFDWWGNSNEWSGERSASGAEIFFMQPISDAKELPDTRPFLPTAWDCFDKIKGTFWQDKATQEQIKKEDAHIDVTQGHALVKEIQNRTDFPLLFTSDEEADLVIAPADTKQGLSRKLAPVLRLHGNSKDPEIPDFGPSKMLALEKMWSRGTAWMTESLQTANKMTLVFQARAHDLGNIQVVMSNKLDILPPLRITIGGWDNTKAAIAFNDKFITTALASETPLARAVAGRFIQYWITLNGKFIVVGMGFPGENVFLSAYIPELPVLDRVGFSSHEDMVEYTEIHYDQLYIPHIDDAMYQEIPKDGEALAIKLNDQAQEATNVQMKLRVPSEGSIAIDGVVSKGISAAFKNDKKEEYKISIGENKGKSAVVYKNGKAAATYDITSIAALQFDAVTPVRLWFSINGGVISAGYGNGCENTFLYWQDIGTMTSGTGYQIPTGFDKVYFQAIDGPATITHVQSLPAVLLQPEKTAASYDRKVDRIDYAGSVILYRGFDYQLAQDGQAVDIKDMLSGRNFHVMKTPQQGAIYVVRLDIDPMGIPSLIQLEGPVESPEKINLERSAAEKDIDAQAMRETAQGLSQAAMSISSPQNAAIAGIALGINGAMVGSAAAMSGTAAGLAAAAAKDRLKATMDYRSHDSPVYTELFSRDAGATTQVADEAKANRSYVEGTLSQLLAAGYKFTDPDQFMLLINQYQEIMRKINHPYVAQDSSIKERIYDDLEKFSTNYEAAAQTNPDAVKAMLNLMVKAYSNTYLVDNEKPYEVAIRDRWYNAMTSIAEDLFATSAKYNKYEMNIDPLHGEYLWLPVQFINENTGSLVAEFEANSDVWVCFAQEDDRVTRVDNNIYEFKLNAWEGTTHEISIRNQGKPAARLDKKNNKNAMLVGNKYKHMWFDIKMNASGTCTLTLGMGAEVGQHVLLKWEDPAPWKAIKYIGIGTWETPIKMRGLKTFGTKAMTDEADSDPSGSDASTAPDTSAEQTAAPTGQATEAASGTEVAADQQPVEATTTTQSSDISPVTEQQQPTESVQSAEVTGQSVNGATQESEASAPEEKKVDEPPAKPAGGPKAAASIVAKNLFGTTSKSSVAAAVAGRPIRGQ